jgi:hypothetical protein
MWPSKKYYENMSLELRMRESYVNSGGELRLQDWIPLRDIEPRYPSFSKLSNASIEAHQFAQS